MPFLGVIAACQACSDWDSVLWRIVCCEEDQIALHTFVYTHDRDAVFNSRCSTASTCHHWPAMSDKLFTVHRSWE